MSPRNPARTGSPKEPSDDLVELLACGVVVIDGEGQILRVNAAIEAMLSYRGEEVVGRSIECLIPERYLAAHLHLVREHSSRRMRPPAVSFDGLAARRSDGGEVAVEVVATARDTTDGLVVVAEVRESQRWVDAQVRLAMLEAFVQASDEALVCQGTDGLITCWNRGAERVFGYLEGEIAGTPSLGLFPEHLRPELSAVFDMVAAGDQMDHIETEVRRKDAMLIPISLSLRPVFDAEGKQTASALIVLDITERRLAQATLAEIEATLRQREAVAHVGGWLWDIGTGTVQWSDETHRIHGVAPMEFDGTLEAHLSYVHPDDEPTLRSAIEHLVATIRPFEREYRVVRPDQDVRRLYVRAEPTVGSTGVVLGLRGVVEDVTDRRRAEDAKAQRA